MASLTERLDQMEAAIRKPSFRQSSGRANEVNYWVFDYPPEKELEVRERVEYLKKKNAKGVDGFELVVFDLYDIIIDYLEKEEFLEQCYRFEKKRGLDRITKAVSNSMKINDDDSLIVQYIKETGEMSFVDLPVTYADGGEGSVYEHLTRILDFSAREIGQNGICKGLRADWNDCLNLGGCLRPHEEVFVASRQIDSLGIRVP